VRCSGEQNAPPEMRFKIASFVPQCRQSIPGPSIPVRSTVALSGLSYHEEPVLDLSTIYQYEGTA